MKKFLVSLFLISVFLISANAATHVQFQFTDPQFGVTSTTNRLVQLQGETGYQVNQANVLLPFRVQGYTDTNGSIIFSNLYGSSISGWYHWTMPAPPQKAEGDIWVQSTNLGLVQASTILGNFGASTYPAANFAWSAQVSDSRYSQGTNTIVRADLQASGAGIVINNGGSSVLGTGTTLSLTNIPQTLVSNLSTDLTGKQPASANLTNWASVSVFNTNGLANTNFVISATNGIASTAYKPLGLFITNVVAGSNATVQIVNGVATVNSTASGTGASNSVSAGNALVSVVTNGANFAVSAVSQTNAVAFTNQLLALVSPVQNTVTFLNGNTNLQSSRVFWDGATLTLKKADNNVAFSANTNGSATVTSIDAPSGGSGVISVGPNSDVFIGSVGSTIHIGNAINTYSSGPNDFFDASSYAAKFNTILANGILLTNIPLSGLQDTPVTNSQLVVDFGSATLTNISLGGSLILNRSTNVLQLAGFGDVIANGGYSQTSQSGYWTNFNGQGDYVFNNGVGYSLFNSAGSLRYSGSALEGGTWTANAGATPGTSTYGAELNGNGINILGWLNSTNLQSYLAGLTNFVIQATNGLSGGGGGSATNAIGNNGGKGTNTFLYGTTTFGSNVITTSYFGTTNLNPLQFQFNGTRIGTVKQEWSGKDPSITWGVGSTNINSDGAVIAGGGYNTVTGAMWYSTISGGRSNTISGVTNSLINRLGHDVIAGGLQNSILDFGTLNGLVTIGGGGLNTIYDNGGNAEVIAGGYQNSISNSSFSAIVGGSLNSIAGGGGFIGAGSGNLISGSIAGNYSTIDGGFRNTNTGDFSSILGGKYNYVSGNNSTVGGTNAWATNNAVLVWNDGSRGGYGSSTNNQVTLVASNGFNFVGGGLTVSAISSTNFSGNGDGLTNAAVINSNFHRYDLVKSFGATNDGFFFNNITIANNSTALTAYGFDKQATLHTNFTTGDSIVGKIIMLWQCGSYAGTGSTNTCFTTTIASVQNGTNLTLSTAVPHGVTNQVVGGVIGSDNTACVQAAYNTISNGSFECMVPDGVYVINGPAVYTNHAQVIIPPVNSTLGTMPVARLKGQFAGFLPQAILGVQRGLSSQGATFVSTVTNLTGGSMIDGANYSSPVYVNNILAYVGFNPVSAELDGVNVIGAYDNNGVLVNFSGVRADVRNCRISSGYTLYGAPKCSFTNSYGLGVSIPSSAAQQQVFNVQLNGFYSGVNYGEHVYGFAEIESCVIGINTDRIPVGHGAASAAGGHQGKWILDFEACKTNIFSGLNAAKVDIECTSESPDPTDWSYPSYLVNGTGGAKGSIRYEDTTGGLLIDDGGYFLLINTGAYSSGAIVTNNYINATTGTFTSINAGSSSTATPVVLRSTGNSLQLGNPTLNKIIFTTAPWNSFRVGTITPASGVGFDGDFTIDTFAQVIGSGSGFAVHGDGSGIECSSNVISGGRFIGNGNSLTNLNAIAPLGGSGTNIALYNSSTIGYPLAITPIAGSTLGVRLNDSNGTAMVTIGAGGITGNGNLLTNLNAGNLTADTRTLGTNVSVFFGGTNANGAELIITNASTGAWAGYTAQADNGLAGTAPTNYAFFGINNSAYAPGAGIIGETNSGIIEFNSRKDSYVDMIGNGGNNKLYFIFRPSYTSAFTTNIWIGSNGFGGNAIGLTNLNAANITTGTLPNAQLPSNVVTNNGPNLFSATNTFNSIFVGTSGVTYTNSSNSRSATTFGDANYFHVRGYGPTGLSLGRGTSDDVLLDSGGLYPNSNNSFDIGNIAAQWRTNYAATVRATNLIAIAGVASFNTNASSANCLNTGAIGITNKTISNVQVTFTITAGICGYFANGGYYQGTNAVSAATILNWTLQPNGYITNTSGILTVNAAGGF